MFLILIGYRIPLPGINLTYLKALDAILSSSGAEGFIGLMTGGSMKQMSIFALSIAPYITASILIQLLTVIIPKLQELRNSGSVGHQKMEKLTYIVGCVVAVIEALGLAIGFGKQGLFVEYTWYMVLYATVVWAAGACFLMWIGETITNKLIGNGTSLLLTFNIISTMPDDLKTIFTSLAKDANIGIQAITIAGIVIVFIMMMAYVVFMNGAEKRIRISNSSKSGKWMAGAADNSLPLKLSAGGVMPVIFASSLLSFPVMIAQLIKVDSESFAWKILGCLNQNNWFDPENWFYTLGVLLFIPLTFAFSYFYTIISFNPKDIADNMRRTGSVVDGVRPGNPTAEYLKNQSMSMLWLGSAMLIGIVLFPTILSGVFGIKGLGFGGTTIMIVVSTILEMKNAIKAQTSSVAYKSLIRRGGKANAKHH
jgi:preprotein translocase subunit SecY